MSDEQIPFDQTRRRLAAGLLRNFGPELESGNIPPAAAVGAFQLAALAIAMRYELQDVMEHIGADVDADCEGLKRGEWSLTELMQEIERDHQPQG